MDVSGPDSSLAASFGLLAACLGLRLGPLGLFAQVGEKRTAGSDESKVSHFVATSLLNFIVSTAEIYGTEYERHPNDHAYPHVGGGEQSERVG